jgi:hypothetical protein
MNKIFFVLFYFAVQLAGWNSHALENLNWDDQALQSGQKPNGIFIAPNEVYPQRLSPYVNIAPPGAYVSVGTERGFIGFALTPQATSLVLIDIDKGIVVYNQINTLLLKISKNRKHYLELRLHPNVESWMNASEEARLTDLEKAFLLEQVKNWKTTVVENSEFSFFHKNPKNPDDKFYAANYLYSDELFQRIHQLAKADLIYSLNLNLRNNNSVKLLIEKMKTRDMSLSVLDISNAWGSSQIPSEFLAKDFELFNSIATNSSLLVTTGFSNFIHALDQAIDDTKNPFQYSIYNFEHMRRYIDFRAFAESLELTRGRVFPTATVFNREELKMKCIFYLREQWSRIKPAWLFP